MLAGGPLGSIGRSQAASVKAVQEQIRDEERERRQTPSPSPSFPPSPSPSPTPSSPHHFNGSNQFSYV